MGDIGNKKTGNFPIFKLNSNYRPLQQQSSTELENFFIVGSMTNVSNYKTYPILYNGYTVRQELYIDSIDSVYNSGLYVHIMYIMI